MDAREIALITARKELSAARVGILVAAEAIGDPPSREQLQAFAVATARALSRLDDVLALIQLQSVNEPAE